jgi:hypothetical protein
VLCIVLYVVAGVHFTFSSLCAKVDLIRI